jgi:ectoine hydroxylase-related dioxygenase (phytanoyl-CoA dioxygenase family)
MNLEQRHRDEFEREGAVLIDGVLDGEILGATDAALTRLYSGPRSDGIIQYPDEPGLYDLYQDPRLEAIARYILEADAVVLNSAASLVKKPQPGAAFAFEREHMDIQFSREEWLSRPRRILCMLMVMVADLPLGRGNTYVRLGSHMQMADHLAREGLAPVKDKPMNLSDLPPLPWAELTPVVGRAGQVLAFNTNLIHTGTPNLDSETRRILFVSFCARGQMAHVSPNANMRGPRTAWRDTLRAAFRPERRYLLDDHEQPPD